MIDDIDTTMDELIADMTADAAARLLHANGLTEADLLDVLQEGLEARQVRGAAPLRLNWTPLSEYENLQRYRAFHRGEPLVVVQMPWPSRTGPAMWAASVAGFPLRHRADRLMLFGSAERAMRAAEEDLQTGASVIMPYDDRE